MIVNETCLTRDQIAQAVLRAFPSLTLSMHAHSYVRMTDNTQQLCTKISPQSSMKQYRATTESPYPHARIMTHTDVHDMQGVSQQEATRLVVPLAAGMPALFPQLHGPLSAVGYSNTHTHCQSTHAHTDTHTRTQTHTRTHTHTGTNAHSRTSSAQEVQYMTWVHHRKSRCIYI